MPVKGPRMGQMTRKRPGAARGGAGWVAACLSALAWVAVGLGAAIGFTPQAQAADVPSFAQVQAAYRPSDIPVLDAQGRPLQTLRVDAQARRLAWVPLEGMSPALLAAMVHSEDRRFWAHSGVDWRALARSAWRNVFNQRTQGGSTLTMQLAGLLDDELARPGGGRSLGQKLGQIATARALDARWRKAEVLEAYLNLVPLRGELVGVSAASQTLFGKHVSGLDAQEAAVLAALVRAPNAPAERVAHRACELLGSLAAPPEADGAAPTHPAEPAGRTPAPRGAGPVVAPLDPGPERRCQGLVTITANALARKGSPPLGEQLAPHAARLAWRLARGRALPAEGTTASAEAPTELRGSAYAAAGAGPTAGPNAGPPPAELRTTLRADLQRLALGLLREQLAELRQREVDDGAVVVLDNASGAVLAWVGSIGVGSGAPAVDAVLARRQPGSTLKPFVYGLALEQRLITPASLLLDEPTQLGTGGPGLYLPQNYDKRHHGWVRARTALAASLNIPAVRLGAMLGPEAMFARFNQLGLSLAHNAGFHGYALALGTAEVTLIDLTNAYRSLANGGRWSGWQLLAPPEAAPAHVGDGRWAAGAQASGTGRYTPGRAPTGAPVPPQARQVMPPAVAWLVADILADNSARALTFGLDSPLVTRGWAAVKTGTSKDMRDNWCIGLTERYTVGVWVGNAGGEPMRKVSGVTGAAPVWRSLVQALHAQAPSRPPAAPPGVVQHALPADNSGHPARSEWFVAGTEPRHAQPNSQVAALAPRSGAAAGNPGGRGGAARAGGAWGTPGSPGTGGALAFGIRNPLEGAIYALDPDIPARAQRIVLEGQAGQWWLNGQRLGPSQPGAAPLAWTPWPGRHRLQLKSDNGQQVLAEVRFEVRGVRLKGAK